MRNEFRIRNPNWRDTAFAGTLGIEVARRGPTYCKNSRSSNRGQRTPGQLRASSETLIFPGMRAIHWRLSASPCKDTLPKRYAKPEAQIRLKFAFEATPKHSGWFPILTNMTQSEQTVRPRESIKFAQLLASWGGNLGKWNNSENLLSVDREKWSYTKSPPGRLRLDFKPLSAWPPHLS